MPISVLKNLKSGPRYALPSKASREGKKYSRFLVKSGQKRLGWLLKQILKATHERSA